MSRIGPTSSAGTGPSQTGTPFEVARAVIRFTADMTEVDAKIEELNDKSAKVGVGQTTDVPGGTDAPTASRDGAEPATENQDIRALTETLKETNRLILELIAVGSDQRSKTEELINKIEDAVQGMDELKTEAELWQS